MVAILVLMDMPLKVTSLLLQWGASCVAILVLMDMPLKEVFAPYGSVIETSVAILVLMDMPLKAVRQDVASLVAGSQSLF